MRQIISFNSVKAISLNRAEVLALLEKIAAEALGIFPEVLEIRLIGSLAMGTQTGTSDIDLVIICDKPIKNSIEEIRPYFFFFSKRLNMGLDVLVLGKEIPLHLKKSLQNSLILACRRE